MTNNALSFQHTETVFTGLSDFHKLVLTVLKINISKNKPREIHYRNYKKFDSLKFNVDLKSAFAHEKIESCIKYDEVFMKVLNRHAPLKKKLLRANHSSHMSKTLRNAIMKRSHHGKKYLKKTGQSLRAYKKQKNYCSRLYKKERKKFFKRLNSSFVADNKLFRKTIKLAISDKRNYGANILDIIENSFIINQEYKNISDPVRRATVKFESHLSISLVKNKITNENKFKFEPVTLIGIELEVRLLNPKKIATHKNIPQKY